MKKKIFVVTVLVASTLVMATGCRKNNSVDNETKAPTDTTTEYVNDTVEESTTAIETGITTTSPILSNVELADLTYTVDGKKMDVDELLEYTTTDYSVWRPYYSKELDNVDFAAVINENATWTLTKDDCNEIQDVAEKFVLYTNLIDDRGLVFEDEIMDVSTWTNVSEFASGDPCYIFDVKCVQALAYAEEEDFVRVNVIAYYDNCGHNDYDGVFNEILTLKKTDGKWLVTGYSWDESDGYNYCVYTDEGSTVPNRQSNTLYTAGGFKAVVGDADTCLYDTQRDYYYGSENPDEVDLKKFNLK